ncbi:MAG: CaiB/BaiF CoA-transferase family protein [Thermoleophilia bacterium]
MSGPLDGITVLDLSRLAPGPYCTMILGDLGADVIQIHDPRPPTGRRAEQQGAAPDRPPLAWRGGLHDGLARNKRSLGLNLKDEEVRALFYRLVEQADVVVEEMRPGAAERLGIDYATLCGINPRIVYCSVTGFGQDGPYRLLAGHDINYIGQAGMLGLLGRDGRPAIPQNVVADYAGGGLMAALGVVSALFARERTGEGQHVDAAMSDGVTYLLVQFISAFYGAGEIPVPGTSDYTGGVPQYDVYETADGKWLSIGSLEPWFFANLCRAIGREDLIEHAWTRERFPEIRQAFAETFRTRTRDEWFEDLNRTDLCANRVLTLDELEHDPQVRARSMIVEVPGPDGQVVKHVGVAPKLSSTPGSLRSLAPRPGEHTDEILAGLGLDAREIATLRERGAVG